MDKFDEKAREIYEGERDDIRCIALIAKFGRDVDAAAREEDARIADRMADSYSSIYHAVGARSVACAIRAAKEVMPTDTASNQPGGAVTPPGVESGSGHIKERFHADGDPVDDLSDEVQPGVEADIVQPQEVRFTDWYAAEDVLCAFDSGDENALNESIEKLRAANANQRRENLIDVGSRHECAALVRKALVAAVRIAFARNNIELEADTMTEEEASEDAADACFGEGTCAEEPIPEVTAILRLAQPSRARRKERRNKK